MKHDTFCTNDLLLTYCLKFSPAKNHAQTMSKYLVNLYQKMELKWVDYCVSKVHISHMALCVCVCVCVCVSVSERERERSSHAMLSCFIKLCVPPLYWLHILKWNVTHSNYKNDIWQNLNLEWWCTVFCASHNV